MSHKSAFENVEAKRLLLIGNFPDSLLTFRGALIQAFLKKGLVVHVAAPDLPMGSRVRSELEAMGAHVHELPMRRTGTNPLAELRLLLSMYRLVRRIKPAWSLAYTVKPAIYGSICAWLAGVPNRFALITGLGYAFQGGEGRRRVRAAVRAMYSVALRTASCVFFQNPDDEALFRTTGILAERTRTCILSGSGVGIRHFDVVPFPKALSFLMIARLLGDKGVREYVEAARQVKQLHPHVRFDLVGWIDENPDSVTAEELDGWVRSGVINFLGRLGDVRPAITDCSVYVLPSYREGTPRTVLEAMAMGRGVITTDAPGCRETVNDGENGFLVPVKNADELARAMLRFIDTPDLVSRMGAESRRYVCRRYDVDIVNHAMMSEMKIS